MQRLMMLLFFQVDLELQRICECNIATDELKHKTYIVECQLTIHSFWIFMCFTFILCRSSFAVEGADCKVNDDVGKSIRDFHAAKKPIG